MSTETVAERFWAESHAKAARRKEIEAMPHSFERFEAMMADVWNTELLTALPGSFVPNRNRGNDLDEWLAEDNPHRLTHYEVPGVLEALGLT